MDVHNSLSVQNGSSVGTPRKQSIRPADHAIDSWCLRAHKQTITSVDTNIHGERNARRLTSTHYRVRTHLKQNTSPVSTRSASVQDIDDLRVHLDVHIYSAVIATELARYKDKAYDDEREKKAGTSTRTVSVLCCYTAVTSKHCLGVGTKRISISLTSLGRQKERR